MKHVFQFPIVHISSWFIGGAIDVHSPSVGVNLHALGIHHDAMATFGFWDPVASGAKVKDLIAQRC